MKKINILTINYIYNLTYQLLAILVPIITTPYVSRVLQADGIGTYSYTLSIVTYFGVAAGLGTASYGQLEIAKCRDCKDELNNTFWGIFLSRIITYSVAIMAYIVFILMCNENKTIYGLLIIFLLSQMLDITWFLQGLEDFKKTVTRNFIIKIISTALIFLFVNNKEDLHLYIIIVQGSVLLGNIALFSYLKELIDKPRFRLREVIAHTKASMVFFVPTVATTVYTMLDKSMIGIITGSSSQNGYYEQAHKIEQILVTLLTSLATVMLPRLTYLNSKENDREIHRLLSVTINYIVILACPMMFGLIAISGDLIPWFLGDGYEECIPLLNIFSLLLIIVGLDNTIGKQCLMAMGRQRQFNKGVILGAIVNFIINLVLIPYYGAIGAAISSVLAESLILVVFMHYSKDLVRPRKIIKTVLKYCILSFIMFFVINLWNYVDLNPLTIMIVKIATGGCLYLLLLVIIKDDFLRELINKIRA